jgi:hypothetical protein
MENRKNSSAEDKTAPNQAPKMLSSIGGFLVNR